MDEESYEIQYSSSESMGKNVKTDRRYYIADRIENDNSIFSYYVINEDFYSKSFRDTNGVIYKAVDYFDSLDDRWIRYLIYDASNMDSYSSSTIEEQNSENDNKSVFEMKVLKNGQRGLSNFIIGAGVNYDFGIGDWNELLEGIRNEIRILQSIPESTDLKLDPLYKMEQAMLNTNYMAPQILKDLNSDKYEETLKKILYANFKVGDTNQIYNSNIVDTNLYQIARIVHNQSIPCNIVNFAFFYA